LNVESQIGIVSKFIFTLLLSPAIEEVKTRTQRYREILRIEDGYQVKALVVENIKENRDVQSKVLQSIGVEIYEAGNGKIALELIEKNSTNIIFMDIEMPVMDGIEAVKRIIKEHGPNRFKIVAISASVFIHEVMEYRKTG
jgi:CheY-like chemotaxis protein